MTRKLVVLLLSGVLLGQSVKIEPNLAVAEAEYRDAEEAWMRNDPNLEADLLKAAPQFVLQRIRRAAALRNDTMQKKVIYLQAMVQRIEILRSRVANSAAITNVPTGDIRKSLVEQQNALLDQQERLEGRLRGLPEGDEFVVVRHTMEAEKTDLVALQNDMAKRIRAIETVGRAQNEAAQMPSSEDLSQRLGDIKHIWEGEGKRAIRDRVLWSNYYSAMERAVGHNAPSKEKKGKSSSDLIEPLPGALPPTISVHHALDSTRRTFLGRWEYRSESGAWVGYAEPLKVELELREEGSDVIGRYQAVLPERENTRVVDLGLRAQLQGPNRLDANWNSIDPKASGLIRFELSGDRRLLVARVRSTDSYIPSGMEVLYPE